MKVSMYKKGTKIEGWIGGALMHDMSEDDWNTLRDAIQKTVERAIRDNHEIAEPCCEMEIEDDGEWEWRPKA